MQNKGGTQLFSWYADLDPASTMSSHHLSFFWEPPQKIEMNFFYFWDYLPKYSHIHPTQKDFHFSESPKNIDIQNFEPQKWSEPTYIRNYQSTHPWDFSQIKKLREIKKKKKQNQNANILKAKSNFTLLLYIPLLGIGEWYFKCV